MDGWREGEREGACCCGVGVGIGIGGGRWILPWLPEGGNELKDKKGRTCCRPDEAAEPSERGSESSEGALKGAEQPPRAGGFPWLLPPRYCEAQEGLGAER